MGGGIKQAKGGMSRLGNEQRYGTELFTLQKKRRAPCQSGYVRESFQLVSVLRDYSLKSAFPENISSRHLDLKAQPAPSPNFISLTEHSR